MLGCCSQAPKPMVAAGVRAAVARNVTVKAAAGVESQEVHAVLRYARVSSPRPQGLPAPVPGTRT